MVKQFVLCRGGEIEMDFGSGVGLERFYIYTGVFPTD